jgi:tripartite-type tricarboxylate transporter receptor subunit TctC
MRLATAIMRAMLPKMVVLTFAACAGTAYSQSFPSRPIRIFVAGTGGAGDFTARLLGPALSNALGQPVVIDNRPGIVAIESAMKSPPDGHTLMVQGPGFWVGPFLEKVSYDPIRDFVSIALLNVSPNVVVTHPSLPVKSVRDLIVLAKAYPGELNYSVTSIGGSSHLAAELLKSMAGVNIVRVPYSSLGAAITSVLGGETSLTFGTSAQVAAHIGSGRLHALAVTSAQPSDLFPGLPTVASSGLPGYEAVAITGLFAPAGVANAIVTRLNQEAVRLLNTRDVKDRIFSSGGEVRSTTPQQFGAMVAADMQKWGKLIRDAGIRAE